MGIYINRTPYGAMQARKSGALVAIGASPASDFAPDSLGDIPPGKALVVVFENGPFDAALLVATDADLDAAYHFDDTRRRTYFLMDREQACDLSDCPDEARELLGLPRLVTQVMTTTTTEEKSAVRVAAEAKARRAYEEYWDRDRVTYEEFVEESHYEIDLEYEDAYAGCKIVLWQTVGSYQGDHVALVKGPDGRIGFKVIGYGSCSGCDALEGSPFEEQVKELERILGETHWEPNAPAMLRWLREDHDREIANTYMSDGERVEVWQKIEEALKS